MQYFVIDQMIASLMYISKDMNNTRAKEDITEIIVLLKRLQRYF